MLNIFTTKQVENGISASDLMIDLSEYIKKTEAATKTELESLTTVVANKLDATPQHSHDMADVSELDKALAGKYDTSKQYSYSVILSDSEKIPYIENPQVLSLEVTTAKNVSGYKIYVNDSTNDLYIVSPSDVLIAYYSTTSNSWTFNGLDSKIQSIVSSSITTSIDNSLSEMKTELSSQIAANTASITTNSSQISDLSSDISSTKTELSEFIENTNKILQNHYEALLLLCKEHSMIDADEEDGTKITPTVNEETTEE